MGAQTKAVMVGRLDERDRELADRLCLRLEGLTVPGTCRGSPRRPRSFRRLAV
jgi:hypothetical protein